MYESYDYKCLVCGYVPQVSYKPRRGNVAYNIVWDDEVRRWRQFSLQAHMRRHRRQQKPGQSDQG